MGPVFETLELENTLGWRIFKIKEEKLANTLSTRPNIRIARLKNNKAVYLADHLPELSLEELKLLKNLLQTYRNRDTKPTQEELLEEHCEENFIKLFSEQKEYLLEAFKRITKPEGPLSFFLEDDLLEEIVVIGTGKSNPIRVFDSNFGWLETNVYFSSKELLIDTINSMASETGRRVTLKNPKLNAFLKDGSRLNACIEPTSLMGPTITIRKFRNNPFTPTMLNELDSISLEQAAFLWMALQSDCSLLICGNTGSGKTTLLNSLLNFVPKNERIIIVEETPEINIPHSHKVKLVSSEEQGIGLQDLITNTLRMRPDRIIVGEIRDAKETSAFMDSLLAGQGKGCISTKCSF